MFKFDRGLRSDFKTERAFLADVYKRNKNVIDTVGYTEKQFIDRVIVGKEYSPHSINGKKVTVIQSLKDLANSNAFTPYKERAYDNVISALKSFDKYQQFRNMTKDSKGRWTKVDMDKFRYEDGVYIYNNSVIINMKNSPEDLILTRY